MGVKKIVKKAAKTAGKAVKTAVRDAPVVRVARGYKRGGAKEALREFASASIGVRTPKRQRQEIPPLVKKFHTRMLALKKTEIGTAVSRGPRHAGGRDSGGSGASRKKRK